MTIQTKRYIELSDIISIRFTCNHCAATLSLLASDPKLTQGKDSPQNYFLKTCPSCGKYWADNQGANYEVTVREFTTALERLRAVLHNHVVNFRPGFSLTLEISPSSKQDENVS